MRYDDTRFTPSTGLAYYRVKAGLSQLRLAELSGVSYGNIGAYEAERRDMKKASYETLEKLANALGCSVSDMLNWRLEQKE